MLKYKELLERWGKPDEAEIDALLDREIAKAGIKFVVLDDDPTGVQTVHDVSVFTDWSEESILEGFMEEGNVFFILTNSRGMTSARTEEIHTQIGERVMKAASRTGKRFCLISRSDSTLRGHYPLETQVLKRACDKEGRSTDGEILIPYFKEGGRFTIDNTHYVRYAGELVPAAETEFAKDVTFGYSHSDLPHYIEEKTGGAYRAEDVTCISLDDLRAQRYDRITDRLLAMKDFGKVIVNCLDDCDMKVFCVSLYRAMAKGKNYMFRTAAGFVRVVSGIKPTPLLTAETLYGAAGGDATGGIVVVGSHTAKTTAQLQCLLKEKGVEAVELNCAALLESGESFDKEIVRCIRAEEEILGRGKTAVCYTDRKRIDRPGETKEEALLRSVKISDGVQQLVGRLGVSPAFVVAKGGITSADIGVKALRVRKARVMGQIAPGVPVWETGEESRFPGIPYVIFPGNVGDEQTLRDAVRILKQDTNSPK